MIEEQYYFFADYTVELRGKRSKSEWYRSMYIRIMYNNNKPV